MSENLTSADLDKRAAELDEREANIQAREGELDANAKYHASDIEFKSQTYAAIYNGALEKDKSILNLCIAGLGFVVLIVQKPPVNSTIAVLAILAVISYLISIFAVLYVFSQNNKFLVELLHDTSHSDAFQAKLKTLDFVVAVSFYLAIVFSVIIGIASSNILHFGTLP